MWEQEVMVNKITPRNFYQIFIIHKSFVSWSVTVSDILRMEKESYLIYLKYLTESSINFFITHSIYYKFFCTKVIIPREKKVNLKKAKTYKHIYVHWSIFPQSLVFQIFAIFEMSLRQGFLSTNIKGMCPMKLLVCQS